MPDLRGRTSGTGRARRRVRRAWRSAAFDLAIRALDQAIARQPRSARLFALRGAVAVRERRYADARADLERSLALDPGSAEVRLDAADLAAALRDFEAAERGYRAAIAARPGDYDAWLARAIVLRARVREGDPAGLPERHRAARDALSSAMTTDPARIETRYHLALLLLEHGVPQAGRGAAPLLLLAMDLLRRFLEDAKETPTLAEEYARAKQLYTNLYGWPHCDFGGGESARREAEAKVKQEAAEREANEVEPSGPAR